MKTLLLTISLIVISPSLFSQFITIGDDGIVRCKDVSIGTTEVISDETYEVVDRELLIQRRNEGADLTKSCVSNVTNMDSLFLEMDLFDQEIGNWDMSSVVTMISMFQGAEVFNQSINQWDVSNVSSMANLFKDAGNFNQPLNDWVVSNVTNMNSMFSGTQFNQDVSRWDVSSVSDMSEMFSLSSFNQDISKWCVVNIAPEPYEFSKESALIEFKKPLWGNCNGVSITQIGNFVNNFGFDSGLEKWNNINGDNSSVVVDGELYFPNITGDGEIWDIQLMQHLSSNQIEKIYSYGTYQVSFDARTSEETQDLHLYFGEKGGGWNRYFIPYSEETKLDVSSNEEPGIRGGTITVDTAMRTYSLNAVVDTTWNNMQVGFEVNYHPGDLFIDNVSIIRLDVPTPIYPSNNSADIEFEPTVMWSGDTNVESYKVLVSKDNFETIFFESTSVDTFLMLPKLEAEITYYWKVEGNSSSKKINPSEIFSFTTSTEIPVPTLNFPSDDSFGIDLKTNIDWLQLTDLSSFQVQVSTDNFQTILIDESVYTNQMALENLDYSTTYFWRVRGTNGSAFGEWSEIWSFTTKEQTFFLHENGVTVMCPDAEVGDSGTINGITYTKRSRDQIKKDNASSTCTSGITNMSNLFGGGWSVYERNGGDMSSWDVSSVTDMSYLFTGTIFRDDIDLSYWDVSNVINMEGLFFDGANINQDLNEWDVSSVTNMSRMFYYSSQNGSINEWDVSSVTNMSEMFYGSVFDKDISNWDVSSVTDMSLMFADYSQFNGDLINWDVSSVTNMSGMFSSSVFNKDISEWDVSSVTNMSKMFSSSVFNQNISDWDVSSVNDMNSMFYNSKFNQDISQWDVSSVLSMKGLFRNTIFNYDISKWNVSSVSDMSQMFQRNESFNQDIGNWNVSSVTDMSNMFDGASNFEYDLTRWCVEKITIEPKDFAPGSSLSQNKLPIWGTCKARPVVITLLNPKNFESDINPTTTFLWEEDSASTHYYLQVIKDTSTIVLDTATVESELTLTSPLANEENYLWRVKGINGSQNLEGNWSDYYSFKTRKNLYVYNFSLIEEVITNVTNHNPMFSFEYNNQDGTDNLTYQYQVTTDSLYDLITHFDGDFEVIDSTLFIYQGDTLIDGDTYYSRIRFSTVDDTSSWEELTFRMNSTPDIPTLSSPSNNYFFKLDDEIYLQVDKVTDAEGDSIQYNFEIYNETNNIIEAGSDLIPSTSWIVNNFSIKEENMSYSWLVRSYDGFEYSGYSDKGYFHFNEVNEQPNPFRLLSSTPDSSKSLNYDFSWEKTTDPDPIDTVKYLLSIGSEITNLKTYEVGSDTSYTLEGLEDNTTYYWKVVAKDAKGATRENTGGYTSFRVNTSNDAPSVVTLITPTNNSVEITQLPKFVWNPSDDLDEDVLTYELFYSKDSLFIGHEPFGLGESEFTPQIELEDNAKYYWKIHVNDNVGDPIPSELFYFWVNTELEPPSPFELISPSNNEQLTTTRPTFNWNKSLDNDPNDYANYTLVVSKDSLFTDVVFEQMTSVDTTYTPEVDMLNNAKYYWKVIATDTDSLVTQSKTHAFILGDLSVSNESESELPQEYTLSQNYPNPFNPNTQISYALPEASQVTLEVFNSLGQKVMELVNGQQSAGYHTVTFGAAGLSSGVYLYKLTTPSFTQTKKMLLMK